VSLLTSPYANEEQLLGDLVVPIKVQKTNEFEDHLTPTLSEKTPKATVSISKKKAGEAEPYMEAITEEKPKDAPKGVIPQHRLAQVHVSGATTINLGNYESAKVVIGITVPTDLDEVADAYEYASDWVSERMAKAVSEAKGA
jgi:hypothetical protein